METRAPKVLRRRRGQGGVLLGLCAGLAAHLGLDPIVVRFALLLLAVVNPAGLAVILVYVIFALCVPYADAPS